jgi:hypothetical protein
MTAPLVRLLADFDPLKYEQARGLRYYEAVESIEDIIKKRIR